MHQSIGLFYGSSTCYTEMAAEKIVDAINKIAGRPFVTLHNIAEDSVQLMANYQYIILGIPTWDYGELQEDWETHWDSLDSLDLSHAKIALYGLGDQIGYPQWFQDAMGFLWAKVLDRGATCVGHWPNQGYQFEQSKALTQDDEFFVGLALDDENQPELTDPYINQWSQQVLQQFGCLDSD